MQLKPITAIIVLLLVVASLLVSGCTTSTTSNTNQTPSVTSSATPSAQSDKITYTSDRGYTITYPKTWKLDVNKNNTSSIGLYLYPNPNNVIDGVLVENNTTIGNTLQALTDFSLKDLSKASGYTLQSFESTTFAGEPANKIVWQGTVAQQVTKDVRQNAQIKATWVFVVHNGKAYIVSYKATTSDYDTYLTQAQEAINSFKFTS